MAEVLGVTASAVGVIGFAGQLAQSAAFCYNFFKDAKDAPQDIENLVMELQEVTALLQGVAAVYNPDDGPDVNLSLALQRCYQSIKAIEGQLRSVEFSGNLKRGKRWSKQIKTALKRPGLRKHLESLDRSKIAVVQACMNNTKMAEATQSRVSQGMQQCLDLLAADQATNNGLALETKTIVGEVQNSSSEMIFTLNRNLEITAQMQTRLEDVERKATAIFPQKSAMTGINMHPADTAQQEVIIRELAKGISNTVVRGVIRHLRNTQMASSHFKVVPNSVTELQRDRERGRDHEAAHSSSTSLRQTSTPQCVGVKANSYHRTENAWCNESRSVTRQLYMNSSFFGTLTSQTTLITQSRRPTDTSCEEKEVRQISETRISYIPSSLMGRQGFVFGYSPWKSAGGNFVPGIHVSLSTFNVRPAYSEIFEACKQLDVCRIHELFDSGLASPFDVDEEGRNLLGWAAIGLNSPETYIHERDSKVLERSVSSLEATIEFLLGYGLDGGCLEHDGARVQSPVSLYISAQKTWGSPRTTVFRERLQFVFRKMLATAESDPFDNGQDGRILLCVDRRGDYTVENYPTCLIEYLETMPNMLLEILIRQEDWPIPWDSHQVSLLCSLTQLFPSPELDDVREYVSFWVTSTHQEIKKFLEAKLALLGKILNKQSIDKAQIWATYVLRDTIQDGAETIALLTEHNYHDQGAPWIRHKVKKLILIRNFLVDAIRFILLAWRRELAVPSIIDNLTRCASRRNLRTLSIWKQALREARRGYQQQGVVTPNNEHQVYEPEHLAKSGSDTASETETLWETDQSDDDGFLSERGSTEADDPDEAWETEEEWEEGYMLEKAVDLDHYDDKNIQMCDAERRDAERYAGPHMKDFDEHYWSHIYGRFTGPALDQGKQAAGQDILKSFARAVASYLPASLRG